MAEELRQRPATPLNWRVQVADDEGCIPATLKFAEIVFGTHSSEQSLCAALVERAKSIFKAQRVQGELRSTSSPRNGITMVRLERSSVGRHALAVDVCSRGRCEADDDDSGCTRRGKRSRVSETFV